MELIPTSCHVISKGEARAQGPQRDEKGTGLREAQGEQAGGLGRGEDFGDLPRGTKDLGQEWKNKLNPKSTQVNYSCCYSSG